MNRVKRSGFYIYIHVHTNKFHLVLVLRIIKQVVESVTKKKSCQEYIILKFLIISQQFVFTLYYQTTDMFILPKEAHLLLFSLDVRYALYLEKVTDWQKDEYLAAVGVLKIFYFENSSVQKGVMTICVYLLLILSPITMKGVKDNLNEN